MNVEMCQEESGLVVSGKARIQTQVSRERALAGRQGVMWTWGTGETGLHWEQDMRKQKQSTTHEYCCTLVPHRKTMSKWRTKDSMSDEELRGWGIHWSGSGVPCPGTHINIYTREVRKTWQQSWHHHWNHFPVLQVLLSSHVPLPS